MPDVRGSGRARRGPRWLRTALAGAARLGRGIGPTGRAVIGLGLTAYVVQRSTHLVELTLIYRVCAILALVSLPFVLAPWPVRARLGLRPARTMAGEQVEGRLTVTGLAPVAIRTPLVQIPVSRPDDEVPDERPVRRRPVQVRLPVLRRGREHVVTFPLDAERRGVLQVGPATGRRTDPLGLFRREARWARPTSLYVRPRMVALDSFGSGTIRDLEGVPSSQISMNDLAFHALREYVRGDDLRHVHWRSSARTGQLHVRQYHDTRRSDALVVVDDSADSYADPEDFELALSIAASVLVRLTQDDYELGFASGPDIAVAGSVDDMLDACCPARLRLTGTPGESARTAAELSPEAGLVVFVTGGQVSGDDLADVRRAYGEDTRFLGLRADRAGETGTLTATYPPTVSVAALTHLPVVLSTAGQQVVA